MSLQEVFTALISAVATLVVAAAGGIAAYSTATRNRRRIMYSEAYKAARNWEEMYYRVYRRSAIEGTDDRLRERFHTLQEDINFYLGWIGSESPSLQRSYGKMVHDIKKATEKPIQEAWDAKEKDRKSAPPVIRTPESASLFLEDVRDHLSWWYFPRARVFWRNRK